MATKLDQNFFDYWMKELESFKENFVLALVREVERLEAQVADLESKTHDGI